MRKLLVLAIVATGLASGCSATSQYMVPRAGAKVGPAPAGAAQVVFLRPSGLAKGIACVVLDADGTFLGDSVPYAYYAVTVKPGAHTFVAWSEGTHAMKAQLAAGKTYYVEISPAMGVWSARFHLKAIKKGSPELAKLQETLAELTYHEVKVQEGQTGIVDARKADADETIRKGVARFAEYNAEEAAERTLVASDGM